MSDIKKTEILTLRIRPSTAGGADAIHTISDGKGNALMAFVGPVRVALHLNGGPTCPVSTSQFNDLLNELTMNAGGRLAWQEAEGHKVATAPTTPNRLRALCEKTMPSDL